ncbi:hypothetical protein Taro_033022 [Colocasia esculenta]|uniref:Uncharacterized protein n=1 Tax=Colocasia esculenta TaxID=4460 RepID=A0A843VWK8_COLES|nr:hypothetical protein [Colocasia esculenta]
MSINGTSGPNRGYTDAHEFLTFLLNELADILEKELNDVKGSPETSSPSEKNGNGLQNSPVNGVKEEPQMTWVHKSFQESNCSSSNDKQPGSMARQAMQETVVDLTQALQNVVQDGARAGARVGDLRCSFQSQNPPRFSRSLDQHEAENWLEGMERILQAML